MSIKHTALTAALMLGLASAATAQQPAGAPAGAPGAAPGRGGAGNAIIAAQTALDVNEKPERCAASLGGAGRGGPPGAPGAAAPARGGAPGAAPTPGAPGAGRGPLPPATPATEPRPRDDARHQCFVKQAHDGHIDLLFVGDSITDFWRTPGRGLSDWNKTWAPMHAANFGIAGDTTQGVLWRMQNGELDGFKAKAIVFMLGTNNIGRNSAADIAAGDEMIIREFRKHQPQAKVLVLAVFPRTMAADAPIRQQVRDVNYNLRQVADNKHVFYMDIGDKFLTPDGTLPIEIMADSLHPTLKGYGIWRDAIMPKVRELMR